jgi:hypothetical protein
LYFKIANKEQVSNNLKSTPESFIYNSNIIKDVSYSSKDADGNEYIINAIQGEIDYANTDIIYLTNVNALIKLNNSDNIKIKSDFGKYNTLNLNTIFSKNVIIDYLDNKITGEYLDFSIDRNSMIISRDIIYTNFENILMADVVEINIKTKDTKIFMYENNKKVNIKSKN